MDCYNFETSTIHRCKLGKLSQTITRKPHNVFGDNIPKEDPDYQSLSPLITYNTKHLSLSPPVIVDNADVDKFIFLTRRTFPTSKTGAARALARTMCSQEPGKYLTNDYYTPFSYTHLTLPTTPYV